MPSNDVRKKLYTSHMSNLLEKCLNIYMWLVNKCSLTKVKIQCHYFERENAIEMGLT